MKIEVIFKERSPERPRVVEFEPESWTIEDGLLHVGFPEATYFYPLSTIMRIKKYR